MLLLVSIWFRISGCELFLEEIFTYSGFRVLTKRRPPSQAAFGSASWVFLRSYFAHMRRPVAQRATSAAALSGQWIR
jgi:hypothetical protein